MLGIIYSTAAPTQQNLVNIIYYVLSMIYNKYSWLRLGHMGLVWNQFSSRLSARVQGAFCWEQRWYRILWLSEDAKLIKAKLKGVLPLFTLIWWARPLSHSHTAPVYTHSQYVWVWVYIYEHVSWKSARQRCCSVWSAEGGVLCVRYSVRGGGQAAVNNAAASHEAWGPAMQIALKSDYPHPHLLFPLFNAEFSSFAC
jgi:hypothetical protein